MISRIKSPGHFPLQLGALAELDRVRGYYVDLRAKAPSVRPARPHELVPLHVITCQWGLGCYDRFLAGQGDEWLEAAKSAGQHLLSTQESSGPLIGAWRHRHPLTHTFRLEPGWISAMSQGQGASLLVRLHQATGSESFAEGALRALRPLGVSVADGGTLAILGDRPFVEEYPTTPSSYVLNGTIFALWGLRDVATGLREAGARRMFNELADGLSDSIDAWDAGYWSRYDLYPHRLRNLAAPWYHQLHINQLGVLGRMTGRRELLSARDRFIGYQGSAVGRTRALAQKIVFRFVVPKRPLRAVTE